MKYFFFIFFSFNLFGNTEKIINKPKRQIENFIFEQTIVSYQGANKKIIQGKFTIHIKDSSNVKQLYNDIMNFCKKEKTECFVSQDFKNKKQLNMRAFSSDPKFTKINNFLKSK